MLIISTELFRIGDRAIFLRQQKILSILQIRRRLIKQRPLASMTDRKTRTVSLESHTLLIIAVPVVRRSILKILNTEWLTYVNECKG